MASEERNQGDVLTREELDALLASLAEDRASDDAASPFRSASAGHPAGAASPVLERTLQHFAEEQTRHLSNVYQSRIEYHVLAVHPTTFGEYAETLLESDHIATFRSQPSGALGFVWLSRPLLFSLLSLAFGARPGCGKALNPGRPYSGVERRIYRKAVLDLLGGLDRSFEEVAKMESGDVTVEPPARLTDDPDQPVLLANIDVRGLSDICRMRIGIPAAAVSAVREAGPSLTLASSSAVESVVKEMPLDVRVELGSVEMTLTQLSELHTGLVIPIKAADDGSLLVRVEGQPKFRGIRGTVGRKVAVQLTERLERAAEVRDGA